MMMYRNVAIIYIKKKYNTNIKHTYLHTQTHIQILKVRNIKSTTYYYYYFVILKMNANHVHKNNSHK